YNRSSQNRARGSPIVANEIALPRTAEARTSAATIRARTGGYIVDMVIFAAVAMIVTVGAGIELLYFTHGATSDSDNAIYAFLAIIAFVAALTDDQNRTLHDRIVGTIVVPAG